MRHAGSVAISTALLALGLAASAAAADDSIGKRLSKAVGGGAPAAGARTVPSFTDAFSFNGVTYPYRMVGTNPKTSTATTTVPSEIIPLRFEFADGAVFDATTRAADVKASPMFAPASFDSGTTQFGDAFRRAEFWDSVSANGGGYHVLLGEPSVLPTVTINVPKSQGVTGVANGVPYGLVDFNWWYRNATERLIGKLHIDPASLPVFISDAVYTYWDNDPQSCCIIAVHGTVADWGGEGPINGRGRQQVNTFVAATWEYPEHFGDGGLADPGTNGGTEALSHEVAEWYDDPFEINRSPAWFSPIAPWYGCNDWLEVGDPLVSAERMVNGFNLQDEAFLSWFAHDVPSRGINGRYTMFDTFKEPSTLC